MNKRKSLLFFAVAIVMVALFAATEAIAGPPAPVPQVICGGNAYVITYLGCDAGAKTMTYSITGSAKNLQNIAKITYGQDPAGEVTNGVPNCEWGAGGTGNNKWLENVWGMCSYSITQYSGAYPELIVTLPVSNCTVGGIDVSVDGGHGLELCGPSRIFGPGATVVLGEQTCKTEILSWDPIEYVDADGNTQTVKPADCKVERCVTAGGSVDTTVLEGDCKPVATQPIGVLLPGVTALPNWTNFNTTMSPDQQCTYYNGDGSCAEACCPNYFPFVPDGSCAPTPDCV